MTFDEYAATTDRHSLSRAKAGDREAFEAIVRRYERLVLRTAQRLLGRNADAQDAAQEVFLRLHASLSSFRDEHDFTPWLYRITVNICLDVHRRRRPAVALYAVAERADTAPDPERIAASAEQHAALYQALEQLPPKERAATVLRDLEGLSTAEVAEILKSSEATVRSQVSSARLKLRDLLKKARRQP